VTETQGTANDRMGRAIEKLRLQLVSRRPLVL
jgi:hypothetical protein